MIIINDLDNFISSPNRVFNWHVVIRNDSSEPSAEILEWRQEGGILITLDSLPRGFLAPFDIQSFPITVTSPEGEGEFESELIAETSDGEIRVPIKVRNVKPNQPLYISPDQDLGELIA